MPSLFARLGQVAGRTTEAVYGEGFVFTPCAAPAAPGGRPDVNAPRVSAPDGLPQAFTGIFVAPGALLHAQGRAMADRTTHAVQAESPMIDVAVGALVPRPTRGDRIARDDTGEVFTVARYEPADFGRAWIHLNDAQGPERTR